MHAPVKDLSFMSEAVKEAKKALKKGEVPVGAVIALDGAVIARGHNLKETGLDPTLHAEMTAIRRAAKRLGSWRLEHCTLYVTLEPCAMCMGAIIQARLTRLVFAAPDPKAGACGSVMDLSRAVGLNHTVHTSRGILEEEASALLKGFFKALRVEKKNKLKGGRHA